MRQWRFVVVLILATCVGATVADAAGRRSGDVVIVSSSTHRPIDHGGSSTTFTLRLPSDASCPGDSAHDQWRVQTFLVPAATDPAVLRYALQGPHIDGGYPLFDVATHPVSQLLLRANEAAGAVGYIDALPDMDFRVFKDARLTPGEYRLGIACTLWRETAHYWDTRIVITAAASDQPAHVQWRLTSAPTSVLAPSSSSPWPTYLAVVLVAIALVAVWRRFRGTR
jgi:hypothetical protein